MAKTQNYKVIKYVDTKVFSEKVIDKEKLKLFEIESVGDVKFINNVFVVAFWKTIDSDLLSGIILPRGAVDLKYREVSDTEIDFFDKGSKVEILWDDLVFINTKSEFSSGKMKVSGIVENINNDFIHLINPKNYTLRNKIPKRHPDFKIYHVLIPKSLITKISKYEKK